MPTLNRRRRPRCDVFGEPVAVKFEEILAELRAGKVDADRWAKLRPIAISSLLREAPALKPEDAAGICDAYFRRPIFIPGRPPTGATDG